jgi:hypothetical protein
MRRKSVQSRARSTNITGPQWLPRMVSIVDQLCSGKGGWARWGRWIDSLFSRAPALRLASKQGVVGDLNARERERGREHC